MSRGPGVADLSPRVYTEHRQRYMANAGDWRARVVGRLGDGRFRQREIPFRLFLAALDFLAGLLENRVVSHFSSGRTADQIARLPALVIGAVFGKRRECIPKRSIL